MTIIVVIRTDSFRFSGMLHLHGSLQTLPAVERDAKLRTKHPGYHLNAGSGSPPPG